jgi:cytochrome P450
VTLDSTLPPQAGAVNLDEIDLSDREFWGQDPAFRYAVYDALRRERPFAFYAEPEIPFIPAGPGYYAVSRYADVEAISTQPRLFCSGQGAVSIADMPPDLNEFYGSMISMDDPRHAKIRRIVSKAFTPRMLEQLVGSVQAIADDVAAAARRKAEAGDGTIDVVADYAALIPLWVICDMMGIPDEDRPMVLEKSNIILSGGDPDLIADENEVLNQFLEAGMMLAELMNRLAAERVQTPREDLTTALVDAEVDGDRLTHQEIASFFILLCVAGNETTRNAITHGVWGMHRQPEQWEAWSSDVEGVTSTAVDEVVRWASPINWMRRTAVSDTAIGGVDVAAGDKLLLVYGASNRDDAVFADPDALDLRRSPNPHQGFGAHGPHFCLGAHLARREITVAFRELFAGMPDLRVVGEPNRLRSIFVNGIKHLPVALAGTDAAG